MSNKPLYRKIFLIFNQEDAGYGSGQEPSGHVKIETSNGTGKLNLLVQNLVDSAGLTYKAYIMKCDVSGIVPVLIGTIPVHKGKGELSWEFKPENVGMTERSIDDFNMATVIVEYTNKSNTEIICPLAAYKDKKPIWREKLKSYIYGESKKTSYKSDNAVKREEIYSKYEGEGIQSITPVDEKEVQDAITKIQKGYELPVNEDKSSTVDDAYSNEVNDHINSMPDICQSEEEHITNNTEEISKSQLDFNDSNLYYDSAEDKDINTYSESDTEDKDINNCIYSPDSLCRSTETKFVNACSNCPIMLMERQQEKAVPLPGDINRLKNEMDKVFEAYYPFNSRRKDYKWWKVNNLAYMNNILYQCSIRTPALFNPKVLMAHFKYRHLILGIYTDRVRRKEYLVFGVPSVYSVDEKPFNELCRWAQLEGQTPQYGAFGYWLMYIDPKTGTIF